jgi:hypothetical protein
MNFIEEYYPDLGEISTADMATARAFVVTTLQPYFVGVDLSPGTVTGDGVISPLAAGLAAAAVANDRLMSDLNLENVAAGLIYSCNFVQKYLGNFAVYDVENMRGTGLVRLTFSTSSTTTVQSTARFKFGGTSEFNLRLSDAYTQYITILAAGSAHTGAADTYVLAQTSYTTWAVDVPLEGVVTDAIARGTNGTATEVADTLIGIAAATDFLPGVPSATLPDLARFARSMATSLTSGNRAGTRSLVLRNWPETRMVSPIITGDAEMQRTVAGGAMILQQPAMDIFIRSARDQQVETQTVRLNYAEVADGDGTSNRFRGYVNFLHRPSKILSVEWAGGAGYIDTTTWYTRTSRVDLHGSLHCGSRFEELYVDVEPTIDVVTNMPVIQMSDDIEMSPPQLFAMFTITYEADPLLEMMSSVLEARDNTPAGVDVIVKGGPVVDVEAMTIRYTKKKGTRTLLAAARENIVEYMRTAGYPDVFSQTAIIDIMRYAGADRTVSIECTGHVSATPATKRFPYSLQPYGPDLLVDWDVYSSAVAPLDVTNVDGVVPNTIVSDIGGEAWASTNRTVRYRVSPENITFVEL